MSLERMRNKASCEIRSARPSRRGRTEVFAVSCLALSFLFGWEGPGFLKLRAEATREYKLKAAFLYHFVRFIDWPEERFSDERSPLVLGVFGRNPFEDELAMAVRGRVVKNRSILVREISTPEEALECHLVFVGNRSNLQTSDALGELGRRGVVTVGEAPRFIEAGGVIRFVLVGDKVRFEINMSRARESNITVSAQLQKLAIKIW